MPSLLVETTRRSWPSWTELGVVLWDPNLGLLASYPVFALVTLGALLVLGLRARRELLAADVLISLAGGVVLLIGFAQTSNFSHGGTPGMSRYALWLVPLALPALTRAERLLTGGETRLLQASAVASALVCVFAFHPRHAENAHRPTWVAEALWTRLPWASNPLAEVFAESLGEPDRRRVPIGTAGCEKVLLIGRGDVQGMWPAPCFPAEVPAACRVPGRLCYANRSRRPGLQTGRGAGTGQAHTFVPAGDAASLDGFTFDPSGVWGLAAEESVRMVMNGAGWRALRPSPVS